MSDDKSKKKSGWMGMNDAINNVLGIGDDEQNSSDEPMFLEDDLAAEPTDDEDIFNQLPAARSGSEKTKKAQSAAKKPAKAKQVNKTPQNSVQQKDPFDAPHEENIDDIFNQLPAPTSGGSNARPPANKQQNNVNAALGIPSGQQKAKSPFRSPEDSQAMKAFDAKAAKKAELAKQQKKLEQERLKLEKEKQKLKAKQEQLKQKQKAKLAAKLATEEKQKQRAAAKSKASPKLEIEPLEEVTERKPRTWVKPLIKVSVILSVVLSITVVLYIYSGPIIKKVQSVWSDVNKPKKAAPVKKKVAKSKRKKKAVKADNKAQETATTAQVIVDSSNIPAWIDYFQDPIKSLDAKAPPMVKIFANQYFMGGQSEKELPRHMVELQEFAVSLYEVTFEEYDLFAENTGRAKPKDEGWGRGKRPVINVSWFDARAYTEWLSKMTGQKYRLPTEAEWEYMATTGKGSLYPWGNKIGSNKANCDDCNARWEATTAPVGSFQPNRFGVFDTSGNVEEWTEDCYHSSYIGAPEDGSAWITDGDCSMYMLRGGSHSGNQMDVTSMARNYTAPGSKSNYIGFRVVREY